MSPETSPATRKMRVVNPPPGAPSGRSRAAARAGRGGGRSPRVLAQSADGHELMPAGHAADVGVVTDVHVPADLAGVHDDNAISDAAVVADVRVGPAGA